MLYNGNGVSADARVPIGEMFDLGDESLASDPTNPVTGSARVSFDQKVAPSLRVGWGNIVPRGDCRWSIPFELGVVFSNAPTAVFRLGGGACASAGTNYLDIATDPEVQEREDEINDDLSVLKMIPVISIGFNAKFWSDYNCLAGVRWLRGPPPGGDDTRS